MGNNGPTDGKGKALIVGDAPGGNYRQRLLRQLRDRPVGVYVQRIAHDDWCGIWFGRKCDCDPDIVIRPHVEGVEPVQA